MGDERLDGWFYAAGQKHVGPSSLEELIQHLKRKPDPKHVLVWHSSFTDWQAAEDIPELARFIVLPPPIPEPTPKHKAAPQKGAEASPRDPRRTIAFLIVLSIVLCGAAVLSSMIYDNFAEGFIGLLFEVIGAAAFLLLLTLGWRGARYRTAGVLAVAGFSVAIGNAQKASESIAVLHAQAELRDIHDPAQIDEALRKDPSNAFLRVLAEAIRLSQETIRLTEDVSNEIEPELLSKSIDVGKASRADLQAYLSELQRAEANAVAAVPRFRNLLKDEREKLDSFAQELKLSGDFRRVLLKGVDNRHTANMEFSSRMMTARADYYRKLASQVAVLIDAYGNYSEAPNGNIRFVSQGDVDRFNAAAKDVSASRAIVDQLDDERKALLRGQQEKWERFVGAR